MTRRALVTGAAGLLGRRTVPALRSAGWAVVATGRTAGPGLDLTADLTDPAAVAALVTEARADLVVHLAGGPAATATELHSRNVLPVVRLLDALAGSRTRLLVAGSAAEYGEGAGQPLTEQAPLRPVTEYGLAKAAGTRLAQSLSSAYSLPLTVFRPFNVVAPDLLPRTALGNLRAQLLAGSGPDRRLLLGRLDVRRDFVTADAVAAAVVTLAGLETPPVVNLCSGRPTSLQELVDAAAQQLGVSTVADVDPALAAIPAADEVIGDPAVAATLGLRLDGDPASLARALLGPHLG